MSEPDEEMDFSFDLSDVDLEAIAEAGPSTRASVSSPQEPQRVAGPASATEIPELEELGAEFEIIPYGHRGDSLLFCQKFLAAVRAEFNLSGYAMFEAVLQYPHNRVTHADVMRFRRQIASRMSRVRQMAVQAARKAGETVEPFYIAHGDYQILDDGRHVVVQVMRMDETHYAQHQADIMAERNQGSQDHQLVGLL